MSGARRPRSTRFRPGARDPFRRHILGAYRAPKAEHRCPECRQDFATADELDEHAMEHE